MAELLFEVGCEEIPAPWLPGLADQLRERFSELASREHLEPSALRAFHTPRRLVLSAAIRPRQADREEKVWGPSLNVARDAAGGWTGAAQGFARKCAVAVEALRQEPKDPGNPGALHLLHVRQIPGQEAAAVLPGVLRALLRSLSFPKRMGWDAWLDDGKGAFPFGRPVRWMVALLDGTVLALAVHHLVDGARGDVAVEAGASTFGHRFLPRGAGGRALPVRSLADLQRTLREHFVLLDPAEREERIRGALAGEEIADDHGLLAEWRDLVEYPTVVVGGIPEEFRSLPAAILATVLVHHQKYLPLPGGRFAAVTNTDGAAAEAVVRGMERVVVARLRDGAFFLAEDRKRPLSDRVQDLDGVTFHQGLGSYREKAERLVALVDRLAGHLEPPVLDLAREAARLAKADLTTLVVREFTELQGVVGGLYLRQQGAPPEVASAVEWHYHPVGVEPSAAPAGVLSGRAAAVFAAVSLVDKLDTLAGTFGLGLVPSGSSDPFGLRRAAQGAVRVLLDFWPADAPPPNLRRLLAEAVGQHGARLKRAPADVLRDLEAFLLDRLRYVLVARGFAADEVEAVLAAREPDAADDPRESLRRVTALQRVRASAREDFEHLAAAFKRARNILGEEAPGEVLPALFQEAAERDLHSALLVAGGRGTEPYEERLRALAALRAPVDRFFDDVLVMAEDPRLRANRLGLLRQGLALFYRIADISKLTA